MRAMTRLTRPLLVPLLLPLAVLAQEAQEPPPQPQPGIEACVAIEVDATRLACYDAAMRRDPEATTRPDAEAAAAPAAPRAPTRLPRDALRAAYPRAPAAVA